MRIYARLTGALCAALLAFTLALLATGCAAGGTANSAPQGCSTVTSQLVTFASTLQGSTNLLADVSAMKTMQNQLTADEITAAPPIARLERQLNSDIGSFNKNAMITDVSAIHVLCTAAG